MDLDHFWDELDAELHMNDSNNEIEMRAGQIAEMAEDLKVAVQKNAQPDGDGSAQSAGDDAQPESANSNAFAQAASSDEAAPAERGDKDEKPAVPAASSDEAAPTERDDDDESTATPAASSDDETVPNTDAAPTERGNDETASDSDSAPESGDDDDSLPYRKTKESQVIVGKRNLHNESLLKQQAIRQNENSRQEHLKQAKVAEPHPELKSMHEHYSLMHQFKINHLRTQKEKDKLKAEEMKHKALKQQFLHHYSAAPDNSDKKERARLMVEHHDRMAKVNKAKQQYLKQDEIATKHEESAQNLRQQAEEFPENSENYLRLAKEKEQMHKDAQEQKKVAELTKQQHHHLADAAFYKEKALRHAKGSHKHKMYHHMAIAEEHKHQALLDPNKRKYHHNKARAHTHMAKLHLHAHKAKHYKQKASAARRKPPHVGSSHPHPHLRLSDIIAQRLKS